MVIKMIVQGMYIADRYEIVGKVGTGGMADVYKALDHTLGRNVAIKVLKSEFSEDMSFVTKFRSEAQSAAGLEHPNIVNIYDVGSQQEFHYIVMEYVEGITLKTYIEKKGQLSFQEAMSIAIQVGRGIEAAHSKGIIHRDIKPQNIIISTEGKVKVTDFGIAKAASANTISSDVMGSVHYSSPEQARNGFVDGKSDIYSLGIVMYEMITGRVPFDGESTVAVAIQHLQEEMVSPKIYAPTIPVSMEKIILKCTQKSSDRRYESMTALLSDLRKSLISPNEDFVVIPPIPQDKTKIIGADEVNKIKSSTSGIYVDEAALVGSKLRLVEEENDDEEDDVDPRIDKAITIAGIAVGIVIVILIIIILVNFLGGFSGKKDNQPNTPNTQNTQSTQVTETQKDTETETTGKMELIDLTGLTIAEAKELLNADGLGIRKTGTEASEEYEEGQIIRQSPNVGDFVEANTTIEVIVSSGPAKIDIPNVKGMTEDAAVDKLEEAGFQAELKESYSDTVEAGKIISQSPGANSLGKKGDKVTITVSLGKKIIMVKVPSVVGYDIITATAIFTDAGITTVVKEEQYHEMYDTGIVIKQSVEVGKEVKQDSKVELIVSKGKGAKVPNLIGLSQSEAETAIKNVGLVVGTVSVETDYSDKPAGTVVSQSISADSMAALNKKVDIVLSKGPEPEKPSETPDTGSGEGNQSGNNQSGNSQTPSSETGNN